MRRLFAAPVLFAWLLLASGTAFAAPSATLQLQPGQGTASTQITATYVYAPDAGSACPRGSVLFTWDAKEVFTAQPFAEGAGGCRATLSTAPPLALASPGPHEVCGSYTAPVAAGPAAPPVTACATFTVVALAASPSPTISPRPTVAPSPSSSPPPSAIPSPSKSPGPGGIFVTNVGSAAPSAVVVARAATTLVPGAPQAADADVPSSDAGWMGYLPWIALGGAALLLVGMSGAGYVAGRYLRIR